MDQGIDAIQPGLETSSEEAIRNTRYLLEKYGPEKIAVIDRFPIAVSSKTRRQLADLARQHGALYETHLDESHNEKGIHEGIYGTRSIVQTLLDDGVFAPNGRVGLAHAIHSSAAEIALIGERIAAGCAVSIRACPQSNAALGSHFIAGEGHNEATYKLFPLRAWEEAGALITLGTDQGGGRNFNGFDEILWERGRHPMASKPSYVELLQMGTVNGLRSLGIDVEGYRVTPGNKANFVVVEMAGGGTHYAIGRHHGDLESTVARVIEGGRRTANVRANWVDGRNLKRQ